MWSKHPVTWRVDGRLHISVVFTWHLPEVRRYCEVMSEKPVVGGPAVRLMPDYLADVAEVGWDSPGALQRHNPQATRTTLGCPNRCAYCGVKCIEPGWQELDEWPRGSMVCDNNILESTPGHFGRVIESVRGLRGVDFQGIEARLLKGYHAQGFASLKPKAILHLGWDKTCEEGWVIAAIECLIAAGMPKEKIRVYVLFGFRDTPEDALYRFYKLRELGVMPNPMRYQPLDALKKDSYVAEGWTSDLLKDMMRFWSRQNWFGGMKFEDYKP